MLEFLLFSEQSLWDLGIIDKEFARERGLIIFRYLDRPVLHGEEDQGTYEGRKLILQRVLTRRITQRG
jgi:hypothetical protein